MLIQFIWGLQPDLARSVSLHYPTSIVKAVSLAKTICTACPSVLCLALLPMVYSGHDQTTVTSHKRQLEDLMMAYFS